MKNLEQYIFDFEGIRVVFRGAPSITEYNYQRKAAGSMTVGDFIQSRMLPLFNSDQITNNMVVVVDGYGDSPNSRTHLSTIRERYKV